MPFRPRYCQWGCCSIPQRVTLAIFLHLALQNAYNMRQVLNLAVVAMVAATTTNHTVDACPNYEHEEITEIHGGTFEWTSRQNALVLYSFFIGYFISHVPGGWLADRYGAKHVLGGALLTSIVITFIFPPMVMYTRFESAVILRGILGIAQGPVLPCIASMMSVWIPPQDRAILGSIAFSGTSIGTVLGNTVSGTIIRHTNSWPTAFYFWGMLASAWYGLYILYTYSSPDLHPYLTDEEKEHLETYIEKTAKHPVPWMKIFSNVPFWANLCGQFGHNYMFFTIVVYLPTFMRDILKMNVQENAIYSSLPFLAMWMSGLCWGILAKYIESHNLIDTLLLRKIYGSGSNIVSAVLMLVAMYVGCNRVLVIALYVVALTIKSQYYSSLSVNVNDMSKHFGGTIFAIVNAISTLSGVVGPLMVGELTKNKSFEGWRWVFWIMLMVTTVMSLIFVVWGSADRQDYDMMEVGE